MTATVPRVYWESDVRRALPALTWVCCGSCHDDEDWGYASLVGQLGPDDAELASCCAAPTLTEEQWGVLVASKVKA